MIYGAGDLRPGQVGNRQIFQAKELEYRVYLVGNGKGIRVRGYGGKRERVREKGEQRKRGKKKVENRRRQRLPLQKKNGIRIKLPPWEGEDRK